MSREQLTAVTVASLMAVSVAYFWHRRTVDAITEELEAKRQEERTGRIRAEVKLRNALNREKQLSALGDASSTSKDVHAMKLSTIGKVISPFAKRMGTPRQGRLVPSSRGYIQFVPTLSAETVDGINEYSHIWIIFAFHENTSLATSQKSKIRPPRAGGIKVGQLATRSPHRPNELGLSLVKMERWEPSTKRLYISALDLVDGTPVYDIKPYVHWDIPSIVNYDASKLKIPSWVENQDDVLPKVEFTDDAKAEMEDYFMFDHLAPLYPSGDSTALEAAMQTLREILAQDPRSSHKGVSENQRGSVSSEPYRLIFCRLEIEFMVQGSGATVVGIGKAPDRDTVLSPTKAVTPQKGSRYTYASKLP